MMPDRRLIYAPWSTKMLWWISLRGESRRRRSAISNDFCSSCQYWYRECLEQNYWYILFHVERQTGFVNRSTWDPNCLYTRIALPSTTDLYQQVDLFCGQIPTGKFKHHWIQRDNAVNSSEKSRTTVYCTVGSLRKRMYHCINGTFLSGVELWSSVEWKFQIIQPKESLAVNESVL